MEQSIGVLAQMEYKTAAITGLIKCYCKYLMKQKLASTTEDIKKYIDPILSKANNDNDLSTSSIDSILEFINAECIEYTGKKRRKYKTKLISNIITKEFPRVCSTIPKDVEEFIILLKNVEEKQGTILFQYGTVIDTLLNDFVNKNKNLFVNDFIEFVSTKI